MNSTTKLTFATVCRNRSFHFKHTILQNLRDNEYPDLVEFLILDYNSDDGLGEWVQRHLIDFIENGTVSYYRTLQPSYFRRSHSRNMAFRLAKGDIICNLDADNFIGAGFSSYVLEEFSNKTNIFLCAGGMSDSLFCSDIGGRICMRRIDFNAVGGYDESMDGYGFEDYDIINRLQMLSLEKKIIRERAFLNVIRHDNTARVVEEHALNNLESLSIHYINVTTSRLLYIFKDDIFAFATLVNLNLNGESPVSYFDGSLHDAIELEEGQWITGKISVDAMGSHLLFSENTELNWAVQMEEELDKYTVRYKDKCECFIKITNSSMIEEAVFFYTKKLNKTKMNSNLKNITINPNASKFGQGVVYKDFDYRVPIIL